MAGHQYLSDPKHSLFSVEEDDIDDETFLRNSRGGFMPNEYAQERNNLEDKRLQLLERKKAIEDRTLQSSERSISLLRDSEQIGVATAEELLRQREQLERTEKRLDEINTTLRFSQKHIQGIKSVFGSFKNYLSGKSGDQAPSPGPRDEAAVAGSSWSPLVGVMDGTRGQQPIPNDNHPGLKVRGLVDEPWKEPSRPRDMNQALDRNLDEIGDSISRLKGLAQGLGDEIDTQNDLVEGILTKTEKVDLRLEHQNKEMRKILKK